MHSKINHLHHRMCTKLIFDGLGRLHMYMILLIMQLKKKRYTNTYYHRMINKHSCEKRKLIKLNLAAIVFSGKKKKPPFVYFWFCCWILIYFMSKCLLQFLIMLTNINVNTRDNLFICPFFDFYFSVIFNYLCPFY